MRKILSIFLLFCLINTTVFAVEFDESIDTSIRQQYNLNDNNLPPLPSSIPTAEIYEIPTLPKYNPTGKTYTLKHGTTANLILKNSVSDRSKKGNIVSFALANDIITKEGAKIPAGTILNGKITDVHAPQIVGNGGLIEITIDEICFNGVSSHIKTKIDKVSIKKVFFNDIKGKRTYWKNTAKATKPGLKTFKAFHKCSSELGTIPGIKLISPVVWIMGSVIYISNLVVAPAVGVFKKGQSISLPSGTEFKVKFAEGSQIKG